MTCMAAHSITKSLELLTSSAKLYSLPEVYYRLRGVLDNPEFSMADVVSVISSDAGMTARLLKMVNSAFYGFESEIHTVSHAIGMIGTQQLQDLVLATSLTRTFAGISSDQMNMATFWYNSVYCGVAARLLASRCNVLDCERLFVAGLLSDIGHLVMYQQLPELSEQSIRQSRESNLALHEVEQEIFGFDYAQAGGELTRQWRLPKILQHAIRYHLDPVESEEHSLAAAIVYISRELTIANETGAGKELQDLQIREVIWYLTGLNPNTCGSISEEVEEQVGEITSLIFPDNLNAQVNGR